MGSTSLNHVVNIIAEVTHMLILYKQTNLIKENVSGHWAICFSQCFLVQGERFVEMCPFLQVNGLKC